LRAGRSARPISDLCRFTTALPDPQPENPIARSPLRTLVPKHQPLPLADALAALDASEATPFLRFAPRRRTGRLRSFVDTSSLPPS